VIIGAGGGGGEKESTPFTHLFTDAFPPVRVISIEQKYGQHGWRDLYKTV
jgi:hypothetical protein